MTTGPRAFHPPLLLLLLIAFLSLTPSPASASTLAVSAGTVCGVLDYNGTLACAPVSSNASTAPSAVASPLAFAEVSAGAGFACGLQAGGAALFCWPPSPAPRWDQLRRVYTGATISGVAVGTDQVAAYAAGVQGTGSLLWWRGGRQFPTSVDGNFTSLVSGDGFSCALEANANASVRCWGPSASAVQAGFANASGLADLAAGGARACAVQSSSGAVLCSGSGSGSVPVPVSGVAAANASLPRDLYGLAVGESHACGLRRANSTAVCWSLGGPTTTLYEPALGIQFELLAAGGNVTCGVVAVDFSVMCWTLGSDAAPAAWWPGSSPRCWTRARRPRPRTRPRRSSSSPTPPCTASGSRATTGPPWPTSSPTSRRRSRSARAAPEAASAAAPRSGGTAPPAPASPSRPWTGRGRWSDRFFVSLRSPSRCPAGRPPLAIAGSRSSKL